MSSVAWMDSEELGFQKDHAERRPYLMLNLPSNSILYVARTTGQYINQEDLVPCTATGVCSSKDTLTRPGWYNLRFMKLKQNSFSPNTKCSGCGFNVPDTTQIEIAITYFYRRRLRR